MVKKHDEMLCREIISVDVFNGTKKGTQKRSAKWSQVVENLSSVQGMHFKVDNRAVWDRYNLLLMNLRRKVKREVKESGIEVEMTETEKALNIYWKRGCIRRNTSRRKGSKIEYWSWKIKRRRYKKKSDRDLGGNTKEENRWRWGKTWEEEVK